MVNYISFLCVHYEVMTMKSKYLIKLEYFDLVLVGFSTRKPFCEKQYGRRATGRGPTSGRRGSGAPSATCELCEFGRVGQVFQVRFLSIK